MSPLLPPNDPTPPSYAKDKTAVDRDLRALWRRIDQLGSGGGGSGLVIISDDAPDAGQGTLWYDTNAGV